MNIAIFRKTLGKYSESFVRQNIERVNGGQTVAVCRYLVPEFDWLPKSKVLVLSRFPRYSWRYVLGIFLWKHRVKGAVVEFLDWASEMGPHLDNLGIPYIALGHGYDIGKNLTGTRDYETTLLKLNSAKKIILPSRALQSILTERTTLRPELLSAIPIGVDIDKFSFTSVSAPSANFLFIGRFVEKKAPLILLLAFKEALESGIDAFLRLGGDGPLLSAAKQLVTALALSKRVTFLGVLPHDQVVEEIKGARAVLQHSVMAGDGDIEGMPIILQESLAIGTPVIATRHSGIPEVVTDGETGYLVEEYDYKSMAKQIAKIMNMSPKEYYQIRVNCRSRAEAHFDSKRRIRFINECLLIPANMNLREMQTTADSTHEASTTRVE